MAKRKKTIYAAGCIVFREVSSGVEVLLEHRPRYDDWSFPKGKRNKKESNLACALREVEEETGAVGSIIAELPTVMYTVKDKKEKIVHFWSMRYESGDFIPNKEVDQVAWLTPEIASSMLTYSHDRDLLKEFLSDERYRRILS